MPGAPPACRRASMSPLSLVTPSATCSTRLSSAPTFIGRPASMCISSAALRQRATSTQSHKGWSRSEEHTSELQSLMRISYAVFCLKKKNILYLTTSKSHQLISHHLQIPIPSAFTNQTTTNHLITHTL